MVNIGTRVAPVNNAFSSSRNAALIEHENVAKHKIIYNTPSLYIECNKNPNFHNVRRPCGSETTLNPGLFDKKF